MTDTDVPDCNWCDLERSDIHLHNIDDTLCETNVCLEQLVGSLCDLVSLLNDITVSLRKLADREDDPTGATDGD